METPRSKGQLRATRITSVSERLLHECHHCAETFPSSARHHKLTESHTRHEKRLSRRTARDRERELHCIAGERETVTCTLQSTNTLLQIEISGCDPTDPRRGKASAPNSPPKPLLSRSPRLRTPAPPLPQVGASVSIKWEQASSIWDPSSSSSSSGSTELRVRLKVSRKLRSEGGEAIRKWNIPRREDHLRRSQRSR